MKVNVKIAGASYNGVPSVSIPLQAGGTATFCEVSDTTATAADVATGKKFYTAAGELATGTKSNITGAMKYAGSVNTYADLPTTNRNPGDVYNVKTADTAHGIKAGENVAWNGTDWDPLGGTVDLSPYATNDSVAGTLVNVTHSNASLTFVKKDGSKVSATVNNVAHATAADTATKATTAAACSGNSATATKLATPRTISLTGNASGSANFDGSGNISINTTVSNADTVDGYHESSFLRYRGDAAANGEDTYWSQIGIKRYDGKLPKDISGTYNYGGVVSLPAGTGARLDIWYNHLCSMNGDGLWYRSGYGDKKEAWARLLDSVNYTKYAPTKTGSGASGTWPISITGNAATATNADKLDGYHASDLFRHLGGNQTPVITDIFDRAGTIDMTTMSAADKAAHKANINKAKNATQSIWNTDTGIHAYGGDVDMANGYYAGTLKLTQSYKNFDKILIVGCNDKGNLISYEMWDVWALANAFANSYRFYLFPTDDYYWALFGTAKHGAITNYTVSTDTVWSCESQSAGILAIYGIKY